MRTLRWPLLLVLFSLGSAAIAQQVTFQPVGNVQQIMEAMVIPSSDALFEAAGEAPTDEKAWTAVRNNAVTLAESGNLLMIGSRARDRAAWMQLSRAMVDAGAAALKAADAKDAAALSKAGDRIVASCENCHDRYLQKTQK